MPIDPLWTLVVLSGALVLVSLVPSPPNDLWWHLKIGELILTEGRIPATARFAWTLPPDLPFIYGAWLGELLMALFWRAGRLELLVFVRNLLFGLLLASVAVETRRRTGSWRWPALAVALVTGMSVNNSIVRPQIWSWLPFAAMLALLSRFAARRLDRRLLLLIAPLMVFWANAHGAFVLGILLLGAFVVGEGVTAALRRPGALSRTELLWLAGAAVLAGAAILLNPRGLGIVGYVRNLLSDAPSQTLIEEWQSPAPEGIPNLVFYGSIVGLLALAWLGKLRVRLSEALCVLGLLWMAWSGVRYILWYAVAASPILVQAAAGLFRPPSRGPAPRNLLNTALAVLVLLPCVAVQPWWVERLPVAWPAEYREMVAWDAEPGPLLSSDTPVAVTEVLRTLEPKPMFHEMGYGSYFIWTAPELGVFIDPRVELYPYEMWLDYVRISNGVRYNALLEAYGAERLVLDAEMQKELIAALQEDPRWTRIYADSRAEVWERGAAPVP